MLRYIAISFLLALPLAASVLYIEWNIFKTTYGKRYSFGEDNKRHAIWQSNVKFIKQHNLEADRGIHSFRLAMNHLGDATDEERKALNGYIMSAKKPPLTSTFKLRGNVDDLPCEVNWLALGYVTPVKQQGKCGACWAFSTTGALEGQHVKKTGNLVSLSEQNLMDCTDAYGNSGCDGGLMDNAFNYIRWNGIDPEQTYPYTGKKGPCEYRTVDIAATLIGWADTPNRNETVLKAAVAAVGPISVAIDASLKTFTFYKSGIYYDSKCSTGYVDHAVLVVGYGTTDDGQDYWLVKNSWGTKWGMDGYIMMSRNQDNNCGIASQASYPIV